MKVELDIIVNDNKIQHFSLPIPSTASFGGKLFETSQQESTVFLTVSHRFCLSDFLAGIEKKPWVVEHHRSLDPKDRFILSLIDLDIGLFRRLQTGTLNVCLT